MLALARALLAVPDAPAVLALLDREFSTPDPDAAFWRAQAQAALGHWPEALASYTAALAAGTATPAQARYGQGEAFLALGRPTEAAAAFRDERDDPQLGESARLRFAGIALDTGHLKEAAAVLTDAGPGPTARQLRLSLEKERAQLLGRLRLAQRQPALAAQAFTGALARPEGLSERLLVDCYWGWTQACLDQGNPGSAQDVLENLIDRYPGNPSLAESFAWLESLYAQDRAPDLSVPRRWSADATEPGRASHGAAGRRPDGGTGRPPRTRGDESSRISARISPGARCGCVRCSTWRRCACGQGRPGAARVALDVARPLVAALPVVAAGLDGDSPDRDGATAAASRTEIDVLDAEVCLAQHDGPGAARRFEAMADRLGVGTQAEAAAFNAVLGWLRATDADRFAAAEKEFAAHFPASPLNGEFSLEEGTRPRRPDARGRHRRPAARGGLPAAVPARESRQPPGRRGPPRPGRARLRASAPGPVGRLARTRRP